MIAKIAADKQSQEENMKDIPAFFKWLAAFVCTTVALSSFAASLSKNKPLYLDDRYHVLVTIQSQTDSLPVPKGDEEILLGNPEINFGARTKNSESLMIRSIRFEYCGLEPQYLPASVFAGLYDIGNITIDGKGKNTLLKIEGGDASSSYRAEIEIAPHGAIRRNVYNRVSGYEEVIEYRYPLSMILFRNEILRKRTVDESQPACQTVEQRKRSRKP
jgi:hypothetical protein